MLLPSKITPFCDSVLSKLPIVLTILKDESKSVSSLFDMVKGNVEDVVEFLDVLDCLYTLGKIGYNPETRFIDYVE